ncbi:hypothetical protein [Streptomyces luteolus]|uniref:Uncharacterized protein n=1 Tax=Streptomyces luteolus TaxID=3043615 RepID=A0ABT6SRV9_9ACTN|nr:hypothetical protein [Streptomyces sp. B-S-A12]MDI3417970.1 hypothetical protein [Streptomyces sp. B-S-A12]
MKSLHSFRLVADQGTYNVAVDGQNVTDFVSSADIQALAHEPPRVVLHLHPGRTRPVVLNLLARVEVAVPVDPCAVVADFLEACDPLEVERAALSRIDLENVPGGSTAAVLRQLAEWARGA